MKLTAVTLRLFSQLFNCMLFLAGAGRRYCGSRETSQFYFYIDGLKIRWRRSHQSRPLTVNLDVTKGNRGMIANPHYIIKKNNCIFGAMAQE